MTPLDWALFVEAKNEEAGGEDVAAPTKEQFDSLVKKYG